MGTEVKEGPVEETWAWRAQEEGSTFQAKGTACAKPQGRKELEVFQRLAWLAQMCRWLPGGGSTRWGPGHAGFAGPWGAWTFYLV